MSPPRHALPRMRPRCCFRYLTFFGINITAIPWAGGAGQAGGAGRKTYVSRPACPACPAYPALCLLRPGLWPPGRAFPVFLFASALRHEPLTLVQPHLDADLAVRRVGFGEAVVDVGAQRLERQLPVQVPLRARDLSAVQPARHTHLDSAGAKPQSRLDGFAHRSTEGDALFELHGHRLGDELAVQLGFLDLLDVDEDRPVRALLDFLFELVDFRTLAADDDAGPRGVDVDLQVVRRALGFDLRHAGVCEALLQRRPQREILVQQLRVVAIGVPSRAPRLVEPEPESKRVNLLTHNCSFAPSG